MTGENLKVIKSLLGKVKYEMAKSQRVTLCKYVYDNIFLLLDKTLGFVFLFAFVFTFPENHIFLMKKDGVLV